MFTDYLGDTSHGQLMDFLGDHPSSDYNIIEIVEKTGMPRPTVDYALQGSLGLGMIQETRKLGQYRMVQLNIDHPVVRTVLQADMLQAKNDHAGAAQP